VKDTPESNAGAIVHALANTLNGILLIVQLQELYLTKNSEQMRQLMTDVTKDLKHELEHVQRLIEDLRQVLRSYNS